MDNNNYNYAGKFFTTGRVDDYLEYKRNAKKDHTKTKSQKFNSMNF